jgi:thiosulfate dehydrogenase
VRGFLLGVITTLVVLGVGGYYFVQKGGVSLAVSSPPLPLEETVAHMALKASMGHAADDRNPLPYDEATLLAGAKIYRDHCGGCHGLPGKDNSMRAKAMFPPPPQLFVKDDGVTDDPQGETYWKVKNGIRLSGMPSFDKLLTEKERWQVTMLVSHADKIPLSAKAILTH